MEIINEFKTRYRWTRQDEDNLLSLAELAEGQRAAFVEVLYDFIESAFVDSDRYLSDEAVRRRHKEKLKHWFVLLFKGPYDAAYLRRLYRIGEIHVRIGLPPDYVNASIYRIREFIEEMVRSVHGCSITADKLIRSANKILDLNLDVMTSAYREEELKLYLATGKTHKTLVEFIRRLSYGMGTMIATFLMIAGVFVIFWVGYDIVLMIGRSESFEKIGMSILGSVLVLYAIGELLSEAVKNLRGGAIDLTVFIGLALAAVVRKIVIVALHPEKTAEIAVLSLLLVVLGITYYLVYRAAKKA